MVGNYYCVYRASDTIFQGCNLAHHTSQLAQQQYSGPAAQQPSSPSTHLTKSATTTLTGQAAGLAGKGRKPKWCLALNLAFLASGFSSLFSISPFRPSTLLFRCATWPRSSLLLGLSSLHPYPHSIPIPGLALFTAAFRRSCFSSFFCRSGACIAGT